MTYLNGGWTCQAFGVDGFVVCNVCGLAIVDGWEREHGRFHEALAALFPPDSTP